MASWILSIDKDHPQHWRYAVEHGLWDLRTPRTIQEWQMSCTSGKAVQGGWVGRVQAREDEYAIDEETAAAGPWDDWGTDSPKPYRARFALDVLDETAARRPSMGAGSNGPWGQHQPRMGLPILSATRSSARLLLRASGVDAR